MMSLLVPLGLLGLLGVVALIIIYIIKPNYQNKLISSTYVWKLSLKYKRRRIPTSKIRNFLIFLCQILILTLAAGVLAMPVLRDEDKGAEYDVIAIIDSSASMYAGTDGDTRFMRAVDETVALCDDVIGQGGYMSVILADGDPEFLARRVSETGRDALENELQSLIDEEYACYFGVSDIDAAMDLCEEVLTDNPSANIYLFTDTTYDYVPRGITIVSVAEEEEWNAAILNATAELEDNFYTLTVQIACYGISREITLDVDVMGANSFDANYSGINISFSKTVLCDAGTVKTVIFRGAVGEDTDDTVYYAMNASEQFFSYKSLQFSINESDNFTIDNTYHIYGGQKQVLKIQYASTLPNPFFTGALDVLKNEYASRYDVQITDVRKGDDYALSGFDLYIFEHQTPEIVPTDGVVWLIDPVAGYTNSLIGLSVMNEYTFRQEMSLSLELEHPLTSNIFADNITVTRIKSMTVTDEFDVLLSCDTQPVFAAQKNGPIQVAVLAFSVHYSTISEKPEFYILLHNFFEYYFPATVRANTFEVGESIEINSRGPEVMVSNSPDPIVEFPTTLEFDLPGSYTLQTTSYFSPDAENVELYVKIPAQESNITAAEYSFDAPYRENIESFNYEDLLIFIAAAIVLLLFIEWWLQWREVK